MLRKACADIKSAQARALEYAVYAGRIVTEIKAHLQTSTSLLTFKQFLKRYAPELPQRTANKYEAVYKQVSLDSTTCYSSMSEALKAWRIAHPPRERFQPPTMEEKSRSLLAEAERPDLPEEERISHGIAWWLDEPKKHAVVQWVEEHGYDTPPNLGKQTRTCLDLLRQAAELLEILTPTAEEKAFLQIWLRRLTSTGAR